MKAYSRSRVTIHRRYKRLLSALACLFEAKIIAKSEYVKRKKRIDALYVSMKEARKRKRPVGMRPVGRPPAIPTPITKCRRAGCDRPAENGYCSREHAPLASYGLSASAYGNAE